MHHPTADDPAMKNIQQPPEEPTGGSKDENETESQRKGLQASVDEGYASSRDEADANIALECDVSVNALGSALSQININDDDDVSIRGEDEEVICRGPTKSKNEKTRVCPYDQHRYRDHDSELDTSVSNNISYLDKFVCLEVPLLSPRPSSGHTASSSDASQCGIHSPSLRACDVHASFSTDAHFSVGYEFSNGSSKAPLIPEFHKLSCGLHCEAGRNGSREERVSAVIMPPVQLFDEVDAVLATLYPPTLSQNILPSSPEECMLHGAYQHTTDNNLSSLVLGTCHYGRGSTTIGTTSDSSDMLNEAFQAACCQVDDDTLLPSFQETFSLNINFQDSSDAVTIIERVDMQLPGKAEAVPPMESCALPDSVNSPAECLQDKGPLQPSVSEGRLNEVEDVFQTASGAKHEQEVLIPVTIEELNPVLRKPVSILPRNPDSLPADNSGGTATAFGGQAWKGSRFESSRSSLTSLPEKDILHRSLSCDQLSKALIQVTRAKKKIHTRDTTGKTYLHNAVATGNTAVVYQLVEKFRKQPDAWIHIDTQDFNGDGPLHYCCIVGCAQLVGYLCEAGASVNLANKTGDTPLHLAAERGYMPIVVKLLRVPSINVNVKNKKGRSPLHAAVLTHKNQMVYEDRPEYKKVIDTKDVIVELLIAGAETCAQDICGETVVHYTVQQQKYDLLQVIMNYGNDVKQGLKKANKHGDTALHLACKIKETWPAAQTQEDYVRLLVHNEAPTDIANNKGQFPKDLVASEVVLRWLSSPEKM